MAEVTITIRRDNGMSIVASGIVDDLTVAEMSQTLAAMLFDASMAEAPVLPAEPTTASTDPMLDTV